MINTKVIFLIFDLILNYFIDLKINYISYKYISNIEFTWIISNIEAFIVRLYLIFSCFNIKL